ncbi:MAG: NAD(P)-binding domain-containing protein, partial [Anaerolineae bacterium]|nr:NAD(P)-binding domain-containing protein [Anaerolineae bacterium]
MFDGKMIGFIGAGNMGGAMIAGLVNSQMVNPDCIMAADPHQERLKELAENFGIQTTPDNEAAAQAADILVVSVKPQILDAKLVAG